MWCVLMRESGEMLRCMVEEVPVMNVYEVPRISRILGTRSDATPKCMSTRSPVILLKTSRGSSRSDMPACELMSAVSSSSPCSPHQATPVCATTWCGVAMSSTFSMVRSTPDGIIVPITQCSRDGWPRSLASVTSLASERELMITSAPACSSPRTTARPMGPTPPTTRAVLPRNMARGRGAGLEWAVGCE
jgi:hypothetical protein